MVALNGSPEFARRRDANARRTGRIPGQHDHEEAVGVELAAGFLHPQELTAPPESCAFRKALGRQTLLLGDDDRQPLATFATTTLKREAAAARLHALAETVGALAALIVGLIRALHGGSP